jgi:hypothetical protein
MAETAEDTDAPLEFSVRFTREDQQTREKCHSPVHNWDSGTSWRLMWFPKGHQSGAIQASIFLELHNAPKFDTDNEAANVHFTMTLQIFDDREKVFQM